jgi:hypothetical protein
MECRQPATQLQVCRTDSERAFEVENDDAFPFPLLDMQTHGQPFLARLIASSGSAG